MNILTLVRKRTPKAGAVIIPEPKEGESYASIMRRVTESVNQENKGWG